MSIDHMPQVATTFPKAWTHVRAGDCLELAGEHRRRLIPMTTTGTNYIGTTDFWQVPASGVSLAPPIKHRLDLSSLLMLRSCADDAAFTGPPVWSTPWPVGQYRSTGKI